ncbi:MAG: hypothetical protein D6767_02600 [Candidatus Hydrogenedentota bacterium]|nr:MAG: hypothetical protein D6767_02600 [Candidatus Hydrogenedentota bacterium]
MFRWASLFADYRPIEIYYPGARSAAMGGTGTASIDSIETLGMNPAYVAEINETRASIGIDAMTRITRIKSEQAILLKPQFIPFLNVAFPIYPNSGAGISIHSPIQRRFPDQNFIFYVMEAMFGYTITRNISVGASAGAGLGVEAERYDGWGFSGSFSLLYRRPHYSAGIFYRLPTSLYYSEFPTSPDLQETMPDIFRAGIARHWKFVTITLDLEYVNWERVTFTQYGQNKTPPFASGFFGRVNPHLGAEFPIVWWPGLRFRTGFFTSDFFSFNGSNDRQILWSLGFGGLAGNVLWGDRLRIDFSLISSFIPSLFWKENNAVEKLQVSFEFLY